MTADQVASRGKTGRPPILTQSAPPLAAEAIVVPVDDPPPVHWREWIVVLVLVILSDVTVYRGAGYAGYALLTALGPILLGIGCPDRRALRAWTVSLGGLLLLLAAKMVWCGNGWQLLVAAAFGLAFGVALAGLVPYAWEVFAFPSRMLFGGLAGLIQYGRWLKRPRISIARTGWLSVAIPAVTLAAFSLLFLLANPDLLSALGARVQQAVDALREWVFRQLPPAGEIAFWLVTALVAVGLLRPSIVRPLWDDLVGREVDSNRPHETRSPLYAAARNTLAGVIVLFAAYLVFEFQTLWFRQFPPGFHYSGYAHQGAAWLTVALALATLVLSLVFRGRMCVDPRCTTLRRLAWLWSLENMLLAFAVYHRLYIYIGFNGLTRMRMVGLFGITAVVIGFVLVLGKIAANRDFRWLLHWHTWTVALAVYVYVLLPIDTVVVRYNVGRILAGDPAPAVQISVHPISAEGVLELRPLVRCENRRIREGVRALLAATQITYQGRVERQQAAGWTTFQCADRRVLRGLEQNQDQWSAYTDDSRRQATLRVFHDYVYQWY